MRLNKSMLKRSSRLNCRPCGSTSDAVNCAANSSRARCSGDGAKGVSASSAAGIVAVEVEKKWDGAKRRVAGERRRVARVDE